MEIGENWCGQFSTTFCGGEMEEKLRQQMASGGFFNIMIIFAKKIWLLCWCIWFCFKIMNIQIQFFILPYAAVLSSRVSHSVYAYNLTFFNFFSSFLNGEDPKFEIIYPPATGITSESSNFSHFRAFMKANCSTREKLFNI